MNKKIIKSIVEFGQWVKDIDGDPEDLYFRGLKSDKYELISSAARAVPSEDKEFTSFLVERYIINLVNEIKLKNFQGDLLKNTIQHGDLNIIAELQHRGAMTPMIDFTKDPLTALIFAVSKSNSKTAKVVVINKKKGNKFEILDIINNKKETKFKIIDIEDYEKTIDKFYDGKIYFWDMMPQNPRKIRQYSAFVFTKDESIIETTDEIIINVEEVKKELDALGLHEDNLYPDIDFLITKNSLSYFQKIDKMEYQVVKPLEMPKDDNTIKKIAIESVNYYNNLLIKFADNERKLINLIYGVGRAINDIAPNTLLRIYQTKPDFVRGIIEKEFEKYDNSNLNELIKSIALSGNSNDDYFMNLLWDFAKNEQGHKPNCQFIAKLLEFRHDKDYILWQKHTEFFIEKLQKSVFEWKDEQFIVNLMDIFKNIFNHEIYGSRDFFFEGEHNDFNKLVEERVNKYKSQIPNDFLDKRHQYQRKIIDILFAFTHPENPIYYNNLQYLISNSIHLNNNFGVLKFKIIRLSVIDNYNLIIRKLKEDSHDRLLSPLLRAKIIHNFFTKIEFQNNGNMNAPNILDINTTAELFNELCSDVKDKIWFLSYNFISGPVNGLYDDEKNHIYYANQLITHLNNDDEAILKFLLDIKINTSSEFRDIFIAEILNINPKMKRLIENKIKNGLINIEMNSPLLEILIKPLNNKDFELFMDIIKNANIHNANKFVENWTLFHSLHRKLLNNEEILEKIKKNPEILEFIRIESFHEPDNRVFTKFLLLSLEHGKYPFLFNKTYKLELEESEKKQLIDNAGEYVKNLVLDQVVSFHQFLAPVSPAKSVEIILKKIEGDLYYDNLNLLWDYKVQLEYATIQNIIPELIYQIKHDKIAYTNQMTPIYDFYGINFENARGVIIDLLNKKHKNNEIMNIIDLCSWLIVNSNFDYEFTKKIIGLIDKIGILYYSRICNRIIEFLGPGAYFVGSEGVAELIGQIAQINKIIASNDMTAQEKEFYNKLIKILQDKNESLRNLFTA